MNSIHFRAPLAAAALACLCSSIAVAQAPAATGPWAKVPPLSTACFQYVAGNTADPFYGKLEAAKAAVAADRDRQLAINAKIEEEFNTIDPMEQANRMQQWMMSHPQEAMAMMQAAQAAPAEAQQASQSAEQQHQARAAERKTLETGYEDARIQAYAPAATRHKALAARLGHPYSGKREELLVPTGMFAQDPGNSNADWLDAEVIDADVDRAYKALCPQWWGANGKFHAYLKNEKNWFVQERIPSLEKYDAPRLQKYAMMSTPAATYKSTATQQAVIEYMDLVQQVLNERDSSSRCENPKACDGTYP